MSRFETRIDSICTWMVKPENLVVDSIIMVSLKQRSINCAMQDTNVFHDGAGLTSELMLAYLPEARLLPRGTSPEVAPG
jgi:hypothetical protein